MKYGGRVRRTKIIATIGPRTASAGAVVSLLDAGVDVFRLNGSHADIEWHKMILGLLRMNAPGIPVLFDVPGLKVRTGDLGQGLKIGRGETLILVPDRSGAKDGRVPINSVDLWQHVSIGDPIYADDGRLEFVVRDVQEEGICCEVLTSGILQSRKGINVPKARLRGNALTPQDELTLSFAAQNDVDYVGISFVTSREHIKNVRDFLGSSPIMIVAKIENQAGYDNRDEVIASADAIMIDRGDLSTETGKASVALLQKEIVKECLRQSTPVIVATELLDSMTRNSLPSKAEVSDVTNAVLDGASATMLSGETAIGDFPNESVRTMREIIELTELSMIPQADSTVKSFVIADAVSQAVCTLVAATRIDKCVVLTRSGYAARVLSTKAIGIPILAVSDDPARARALNLYPGVQGVVAQATFSRESAEHIRTEVDSLVEKGLVYPGERILVTGLMFPEAGDRMNFLHVLDVRHEQPS